MKSVISEHYENMTRDLGSLSSLLKRIKPKSALASPLPNTARGMESEPVTTIALTEHFDKEALSLAAACYQDLHIHPSHSQKTARRTVGVLWLSPTKDPAVLEVPNLVGRINEAKAAIEEYVISNFHTRQERFEAIRADCPGVMTMHLYRQIRCFTDENVSSVRFSWQRKDSLVKPVKAELVQRITEELERSGPEYQLPLEQLIQRITSTPEMLLRVRRQVRVQPVANIRIGNGLKTVTAPMPLIFVQSSPLKIKALGDFDAAEHRKVRSDKVDADTLGTFGGVTIEAFPA